MLEPICLVHGQGSGSLDDIMLEDNSDMDKELDDFFGSEAEVGQFLKPLTLSYMGAIAFTKHVFSELILSLPGSNIPSLHCLSNISLAFYFENLVPNQMMSFN